MKSTCRPPFSQQNLRQFQSPQCFLPHLTWQLRHYRHNRRLPRSQNACPPSLARQRYLSTTAFLTEDQTVTLNDSLDSDEEPPYLTPEQAQSLTQLHVGNVYNLGVVRDSRALAAALRSDASAGVDPASLAWREARYGINRVARPSAATFLELLGEALDEFTVKILLAAGASSLGLEFLIASREGKGADWIEGASILAAVVVVVMVTAGNNWQKEQQFRALQEVQSDTCVRCVRGGRELELSVHDVLVGDLLVVETGDVLCADGVLVSGSDIKVDESHLTGEPNDISKDAATSQALYSGSKVISGFGHMLVTAVGPRSQAGSIAEMISSGSKGMGPGVLASSSGGAAAPGNRLREETLLQKKLGVYAERIGQLGLGAALLATAAMALRFSIDVFVVDGAPWDWEYLHNYLNFFITGVTILVVAVPEGLPLAVTISLAYSVMRMLADNNLVRHLGGAEIMGTANVILTDKTGTLTQNRMSVTKLWLAGELIPNVLQYTQPKVERADRSRGGIRSVNGSGKSLSFAESLSSTDGAAGMFPLREALMSGALAPEVVDLLCSSVALNCTANVYVDGDGEVQESGNRTEIALIQLIRAIGGDVAALRGACAASGGKHDGASHALLQVPFTSTRKAMTTVVPRGTSQLQAGQGRTSKAVDGARVFTKGAAEVVLRKCTWQLLPDGSKVALREEDRQSLLQGFQQGGLRLLCLAYRDIDAEAVGALHAEAYPDSGSDSDDSPWDLAEEVEKELTLVALVGIADPLRPEVPDAIAECNRAGIEVKMLTGDNYVTASAIAAQCGILPAQAPASASAPRSGTALLLGESCAVMEGEEFRARVLAPDGAVKRDAFLELWPRLKVLARCTPADKYTMVTAARAFTTDVVAVTGDGTNDAPALSAANVGFAMNDGTQVAKEAADIILMDNNFASTVSAALWGRNVYANISRFLQFQLTINLVAVLTAVGGAVSSAESPLSAVQLLWLNLIMDSLASLALATEPPSETLLDLPPFGQDHQFLDPSSPMLKHVLGQAVYQLGVLAWLLACAPSALGIPAHLPGEGPSLQHTLVFNAFVVMQLFNQVNARQIRDSGSVWEGLADAKLFQGILAAELALQIAIVEWGGAVFSTVPLSGMQWALCVAFGAGGLLVREGLRRLPLEKWWADRKN